MNTYIENKDEAMVSKKIAETAAKKEALEAEKERIQDNIVLYASYAPSGINERVPDPRPEGNPSVLEIDKELK